MPRATELEVAVRGREFVAIENDAGFAAVARGSAEQLMLPALAEFPQIGVGTVRRRHAGIVLLDAAAHFRDQGLLQARGVAEQALGMGIFRLEVLANLAVENRGIAQHLLPSGILQPGIVVPDRDAMGGELVRMARRDRR